MKLSIVIVAALVALFFVAPTLAETDKTYFLSPMLLKDDSGVNVELEKVVASDLPRGSYIITYPPSQYRYYTLYYWLSNPTDKDIRYQFKISFVDSNGTEYWTEENIGGYGVGARGRFYYSKEFIVPRNASDLYLRWYHINAYLNVVETTRVDMTREASPTPTATPTPTAVPSPTPTPTPQPAATWSMPMVPLAIAAGGCCAAWLLSRRPGC